MTLKLFEITRKLEENEGKIDQTISALQKLLKKPKRGFGSLFYRYW